MVICRSTQAISSLLTVALSRGMVGYRASAMGGLGFSPRITPSRGDLCIIVCRRFFFREMGGRGIIAVIQFPHLMMMRDMRWCVGVRIISLCVCTRVSRIPLFSNLDLT